MVVLVVLMAVVCTYLTSLMREGLGEALSCAFFVVFGRWWLWLKTEIEHNHMMI
jgi:hypothetical protein